MKILHLNLRKKWFEMILAKIKPEEYRELTAYWEVRFCNFITDQLQEFKDYNTVIFSNGYAKDRPQFAIELKGITIREGKSEWGAEEGKEYFVLELGDIIWRAKKGSVVEWSAFDKCTKCPECGVYGGRDAFIF